MAAKQTIADLLWDVSYGNWCNGDLRRARSGFLNSWLTKPTLRAAIGYFKAFIPRTLALAVVRGSKSMIRSGELPHDEEMCA